MRESDWTPQSHGRWLAARAREDRYAASQSKAADLLVEEGDAAGDYLERLLDILDYDGDIDLDVEGERAVVSIVGGGDLEKLVGDRGVCARCAAGTDPAGGRRRRPGSGPD